MSNLDEARVRRCMEMFDAANAEDPNRDASGAPKELAYARQMSAWLVRLEPNAPDEVRLAVRAQHIRRWEIPRDSYPAGRSAYLAWRRNLGRFHADTAGAIMRDCGVDDDNVLHVQAIIRKERFKTDRLAQLLEDVACLVFLDHYFAPFAGDQAEDSMVNILRKTWKKMSEAGRAAALQIEYSPQCQGLLDKALGND